MLVLTNIRRDASLRVLLILKCYPKATRDSNPSLRVLLIQKG